MRLLLLFSLFFTVLHFLLGQSEFIKAYDLGKPGLVFSDMLLFEDTLVVCGLAFPEVPPYQQGLLFAKIDTLGNVLSYSLHIDPLGNDYVFAEIPNKMIKVEDGTGYLLLAAKFQTNEALVVKLDNEGAVEWIKEYPDSLTVQDRNKAIVEVPDGFLVGGEKYLYDYQGDLYLMKIDKSGNKIWEKSYAIANNRRDAFENIFKTGENEYIISSSTGAIQNVPWQQWQNTVKIFAIDSLGNEKWSWESSPSLEELWIKGLQKTDDGGWAYATARGEFEFDGYMKRQAKFIIRDSNFNVVEERLLDDLDLGFYNYLLDVIPSQAGGWVGVGANFEWVTDPVWAESHVYAWIVRIDEAGDTLWTRNDLTFPDTPTYASLQFLHSAVELPSGSIIAAGYYQPDGPGPNLGVLIKVDKEGCLVNCTPLTTTEWFERPKIEIAVFPNPADSEVNFSLTGNIPQGENELLVRDIYGRLVAKLAIGDYGSMTWDSSNTPSGIYFYQFLINGKPQDGGKLILDR
ncbi:MAG: T9SS type A sorting domain-containing protein [Saprospiraceae bacterium]